MTEHAWRAPSGVRVTSCRERDDARGVRSFVAYLAYYMLGWKRVTKIVK